LIAAYAERLARKLSYDRALAHRVRQEVEDHLRASASADGGADAERRAVAAFGDPHIIAAHFAATRLSGQAKALSGAVVLAAAGAFLAMKVRIAWYDAAQWGVADDFRSAADVVATVDRFAFWLAVIVAAMGWALTARQRATPAFDRPYRNRLHRYLWISVLASAALLGSVVCDGILTALRLLGTAPSMAAAIPVLSMLVEIGCVAVVIAAASCLARRLAASATLSAP
jgi:hypothetical protein